MRLTFADIRDTVLVGLACVVAGVLVLVPYNIGVPLCALALSWLAFKRGFGLAVFVALAAGGVLALMGPLEAALASIVMLVAGPWAASRMRSRSPWMVFGVLTVVVFAATFGEIAIAAAASGSNLPAFFAETAKQGAAQAVSTAQSWGASTAALQGQIGAMQVMIAQVLPSVFFLAAALSALLSVYAVGWVGRRAGRELKELPPLGQLDLSFHIAWPLIAGLAVLAIVRYTGGANGPAGAIAWNLAVLARGALFLQGVAVFAGLYDKAKLGGIGRTIGYVLLVLVEVLTPVLIPIGLVSITGLIDLWLNIRKLPRGGTGEPAEEPVGGA